jgi:hypothetical protein
MWSIEDYSILSSSAVYLSIPHGIERELLRYSRINFAD